MKKILIFSWTGLVSVILLLSIIYLMKRENENILRYNQMNTSVFSSSILDSLCTHGKFILLTITTKECDMCKLIDNDPALKKYPLLPIFFEREANSNNMLLSQALPTYKFPTSYLLDEKQNIIGYFSGAANIEENIGLLLLQKNELLSDTLSMLTNSLKSLQAYLDNEIDVMYHYVQESMSFESYFFNNYILYTYYQ